MEMRTIFDTAVLEK